MINHKIKVYIIFTISLFIFYFTPYLLIDDMHMDGMIYGGLSSNLSHNIGEFWKLHFSKSSYQVFHEHPPLAIYLENLFLRLINKDIFTVKLYSISTFLFSSIIISLIWIKLGYKKIIIPLLVWFSIPLVRWGSWNNLLENTMTIFCVLTLFLYLTSIKNKYRLAYLIVTGISIFLAFLSKGVFCLFLLGIPFYHFFTTNKKNIRQLFYETLIISFSFIFPIFCIIHYNYEGALFFEKYLTLQVINSVQNIVTQKSRFYVIYGLIMELFTPILIILTLFFILKKQNKITKISKNEKQVSVFFLIIGLSGIIPMLISRKQNDFYIISTLPFFAISLSIILNPYLIQIRQFIKNTISYLKIFSFLLISSSLALILSNNHKIKDVFLTINETLTNYNSLNNFYTPSRVSSKINDHDKIVLEDIDKIVKYLHFGESVFTDQKTWLNMKIQGYFVLKKNITIEKINKENRENKIIIFNEFKQLINLKDYNQITKSNKKLNLYYKKTLKS